MIVGGIDIGSLSANSVIMQFVKGSSEGEILSYSIIPTGVDDYLTAKTAFDEALKKISIKFDDLEFIVSTGYGRINIPFAKKNVTEISCHARGAHWAFPTARTILDMGGQDCKVITCDEKGKVKSFIMNDKCAAGAGRSMEIMANILDVKLEDIGDMSLDIKDKPSQITSTCVLFARSEVVELLSKGVHKNDILAGACDALTHRTLALMGRAGIEKDFIISGGIAKNIGVTKRVEEKLGVEAKIYHEPQIIGAIGAAIFAHDAMMKTKGN